MKDYIVKRFTDIEGDQNRGWRVDELRLETEDGEEIGYMKLAQIPFKRFKSHYPNILYFFDKIKGWCGFAEYYEENDWKSIATLHKHMIDPLECQVLKIEIYLIMSGRRKVDLL